MEQAATNLSEIAADSVRIWDASSRGWVETFLAYPNATSNQMPALDGMLAYIAQQKLGAGSVNNRYVTVRRTNFFTVDGDTHVTQKPVTLQVVKRPVFMDIFAPTFVTKTNHQSEGRPPHDHPRRHRGTHVKTWNRSQDPLRQESS